MSELSDAEKKAIERLNQRLNQRYDFLKENPLATNVLLTLDIYNLGIVLNLIETQQKEIEELKEVKWYYEISRASNDKIKAKIEELEEYVRKYHIRIPMPEEYRNRESWGTEVTIAQKEYISKEYIREIIEKHYPDVAVQKIFELLEE